jgi:hypothetical protein
MRRTIAAIRMLMSRKLGKCPKCMKASARGAFAGWIAYAILYLVRPTPLLRVFVLAVAASFSLLMISHIVAYTLRVTFCLRNSARDATGQAIPGNQSGSRWSRRQLLRASVQIGLVGGIVATFGSLIKAHAACPAGSLDCGNGWCCPADTPYFCGYNSCKGVSRKCFRGATSEDLKELQQCCSSLIHCG